MVVSGGSLGGGVREVAYRAASGCSMQLSCRYCALHWLQALLRGQHANGMMEDMQSVTLQACLGKQLVMLPISSMAMHQLLNGSCSDWVASGALVAYEHACLTGRRWALCGCRMVVSLQGSLNSHGKCRFEQLVRLSSGSPPAVLQCIPTAGSARAW